MTQYRKVTNSSVLRNVDQKNIKTGFTAKKAKKPEAYFTNYFVQNTNPIAHSICDIVIVTNKIELNFTSVA